MKYLICALLLTTVFSCGRVQQQADEKSCCTPSANAAEIASSVDTSQSLYAINADFQNQDNETVKLQSLKGKPVVVGMIFTHCGYACPKLTADIQSIESKLGKHKNDVHYLLVSFDVERDKPERLKAFAKSHGLDNNFTLLHGDEDAVRMLSVLLNVQYEKDADGNFSHSNLISVLDAHGNLVFRKDGLDADHAETIKIIEDLLHSKA